MPGRKNFEITRGVIFNPYLIYKVDGVVQNITGYTATMTLKRSYDATATVASYTTANSKLSITGASGRVDIDLTATDTAALAAGKYVYNLDINSGSEKIGLLHGVIEVKENTNA